VFFIDIAVPRDIDPKVNGVENVYLYDMDDLQGVVASNLEQRGKEAEKAEQIIDQEIAQFFKWLSSLQVTPTIVALRSKFEDTRQAELAKTLAARTRRTAKRLEALTRRSSASSCIPTNAEADRAEDTDLRGRPAPDVRAGDGSGEEEEMVDWKSNKGWLGVAKGKGKPAFYP
jgi:hypothetical protein